MITESVFDGSQCELNTYDWLMYNSASVQNNEDGRYYWTRTLDTTTDNIETAAKEFYQVLARINTDIMFRVYNNMNTYHDDIDTIFNWLYNIHYVNMVDNAESNGGLTNWVDLMRQYYGNTNPIVIKVDITDWKERTNHYDLLQNYVRNCIKETTKNNIY